MRREFFTGKPVAVLKPFNRHFGSHSWQPEPPSQVRNMRNITKRTAYGILRVSFDNKRFGGNWCRFKNSDYGLIQERMVNTEYITESSHTKSSARLLVCSPGHRSAKFLGKTSKWDTCMKPTHLVPRMILPPPNANASYTAYLAIPFTCTIAVNNIPSPLISHIRSPRTSTFSLRGTWMALNRSLNGRCSLRW
jgi:hypothetical protein